MRPKKYADAAEKQKAYREKQAVLRNEGEALRLANKVTKEGGNVTESVTIESNVTEVVSTVTPVTVEWDKEKYPERKAWEIAVVRVERAKKYAAMFPQFIHASDSKYQDLDWQYENEGLPSIRVKVTMEVPA